VSLLKDIVKNIDSKGLDRRMYKKKLNSIIEKYKLSLEDVNMDYDFRTDDTDLLYALFLAWLDINKSIVLGRTIAESLPNNSIPKKFKKVIERAMEISQNVRT